ncbi:aminotransferase class IV [Lutibaculum baratangense]|uniref:Probable branched-chain-amino-acid aminotransferase n=1 Tax=Lutibaculum baratangense AMV1 TaxID=631454 RepID=V4TMT3_9HYPH|nr:aminotransferase class IV [Lutibaculum baratangense]ESR27053.1 Aminodeoxychorismate lyase [Lutibaculum baratangense AMV1]
MLWLDGALHESTRAPFDLRDRGLLLADGLFETLLVLEGRPVHLDLHMRRLMDGAKTLGIDVDLAEVESATTALAAVRPGHAIVRVTVTRGVGERGLKPSPGGRATVFGIASPWSPAIAFQPLRLATSTIRRNHTSPLSRLKSLSYLDNVLALQEALAAGADDALILSTTGNVACTSAGNVFAVVAGELLTPPVADGVLGGTIRARLLSLADSVGLRPREASLRPADLARVDAVFVTNSARLACPVTALDGHAIAAGSEWHARVEGVIRRDIAADAGVEFPAARPA